MKHCHLLELFLCMSRGSRRWPVGLFSKGGVCRTASKAGHDFTGRIVAGQFLALGYKSLGTSQKNS